MTPILLDQALLTSRIFRPGPPSNATIDGRSVGMEVDYVGVYNSV